MPTLVQQPAVANTQVSQLQAIAKPVVQKQGLSDFVLGLLPKATQAISDMQKDGEMYNRALGMNDELNDVTRDVSWVHRKAYSQGHEIQAIQTGIAWSQSQLQQELYQRIKDNPELSQEEALRPYKERNDMFLTAIHESTTLPDDVKEKMYEAQLQTHAQQVKDVASVYEQVSIENEVRGRQARGGALYTSITKPNATLEDTQLAFNTLVSNSYAAVYARGDLNEVQKNELHQKEVREHILNITDVVSKNTELDTAQNLRVLSNIEAVVNNNLLNPSLTGVEYSAWVDAQDKVRAARERLYTDNQDRLKVGFIDDTMEFEIGTSTYDEQTLRSDLSRLDGLYKTGQIAPNVYAAEYQRRIDIYEKGQKALLDGEDLTGEDILNQGLPPSQYNALNSKGIGDNTEYNAKVAQVFMARNAGNPMGRVVAGLQMINYADNGGAGENNPSLRKDGADLVWDNLSQHLFDPQSHTRDDYQRAEQNFNLMAAQYKAYIDRGNVTGAQDLLGNRSLNDAQRLAMQTVLEQGGSFKSAIQAMQRAETLKGTTDSYLAKVQNMDTKSMGLNSWFGGVSSVLGYRSTKIGNAFVKQDNPNAASKDDILAVQSNHLKEVLRQSSTSLAESSEVLTPENVVTHMQRKGLIIPSYGGYNAATVNYRTGQALRNIKGMPSNAADHYLGMAFADVIKTWSTKMNVESSNVFITTKGAGMGQMYIQHLNKDGVLSAPSPVIMSKVQQAAKIYYDNDVNNAKHPKITVPQVGTSNFSIRGGNSSSILGGTLQPSTYTYRQGATIGNIQLTAVNSAHRGQKFNVKVPAKMSTMFNGNADLTMQAMNHLGIKEGFFMQPETVYDKTSGKGSTNGGLQISLTQNPKWDKRIKAASGNAQALMNVQADFMSEYFSDLQQVAKSVGIPPATQRMYPQQHKNTQLYLMDLIYHGGSGTKPAVKNSLNQPTSKLGLQALRNIPAYKSSQPQRRKFLEQSLLQHYSNMGRR